MHEKKKEKKRKKEKKGNFCRTESVAMTTKSRDHMPTTSLWEVAAKWPTRASTCGIPWAVRNRTHWSARYTNGRDAAQQESQLVGIV